MSYALLTLWHERQRYFPGVLAVAFSAVLIATQCGLLTGLLSITSIPVDFTRAHLWVGSTEVGSVDLGQPIPYQHFNGRLTDDPDVRPETVEPYMQGFARWKRQNGATDLCMIVGSQLDDGASGAVQALTPQLREALTEPDAVVVDRSELGRLDLTTGIGETGEILGRRVRVVGLVDGYKSLAGPYVFCSAGTARSILRLRPDQATYLLAKCKNAADAPAVAKRLREKYAEQRDMSVFTAEEFSARSRMHWLFKTKAGVAIGYTALLGLFVGSVVTSQTLYAATVASVREYAILRALGIPRWRMMMSVLYQSFWVGLAGVIVAVPAIMGMSKLAEIVGAKVLLDRWLLVAVLAVTLFMAMISGVIALRSLRQVEPANLLR